MIETVFVWSVAADVSCAFIFVIVRLALIGTFYIEFDGRHYNVWRRSFLAKKWYGRAPTEAWARQLARDGKRRPPKKFWLV